MQGQYIYQYFFFINNNLMSKCYQRARLPSIKPRGKLYYQTHNVTLTCTEATRKQGLTTHRNNIGGDRFHWADKWVHCDLQYLTSSLVYVTINVLSIVILFFVQLLFTTTPQCKCTKIYRSLWLSYSVHNVSNASTIFLLNIHTFCSYVPGNKLNLAASFFPTGLLNINAFHLTHGT